MVKKLMLVLSMFSLAGYGAVEISNVKAKQRYPWNEYIDLKFDLDCGSRPSATVTVSAKDKLTGKYLPVNTLWEVGNGPTNNYLVISSGKKHLIWNAGADLPSGYSSQNVDVTVTALAASEISSSQYFIIDLSAGPNATSYPKYFIDAIPAEGWTDEFKTTKLVMRCVNPTAFKGLGRKSSDWSGMIGDGVWDESVTVSLSKKYYIGVFEITQKQWELVMGTNPSIFKGDTRPVENVSWDMVRGGTTNDTSVVEGSFIDRIRKRIGYDWFELPTYAQWECACRAGTQTAFNNGTNGSVIFGDDTCIFDVAWYRMNSANQTHAVGLLKPNKWGLYDMHGNVWEYCLDTVRVGDVQDGTVDPIGKTGKCEYDYRGGDWWSTSLWSQSALSLRNWSGALIKSAGFRLSFTYP